MGVMPLSLIVPVCKEEKNVPEFLRRLQPILAPITEDYEIIFPLDPSPDRTCRITVKGCCAVRKKSKHQRATEKSLLP